MVLAGSNVNAPSASLTDNRCRSSALPRFSSRTWWMVVRRPRLTDGLSCTARSWNDPTDTIPLTVTISPLWTIDAQRTTNSTTPAGQSGLRGGENLTLQDSAFSGYTASSAGSTVLHAAARPATEIRTRSTLSPVLKTCTATTPLSPGWTARLCSSSRTLRPGRRVDPRGSGKLRVY